jgi:hypothetical protein
MTTSQLAAGAAQPEGQPPAGGQGQGQGDPAGQYAGYLKGVPEQFHGQLLDGFKRTDGHWQKQLQDVQSRYQPYEQILSAYQPDQLQAATDLLGYLQADPATAVAELQAALGLGQQADQGGVQSGETYDDDDGQQQFQLPAEYVQRLDQMEQLLTMLAQQTIDQRNEAQVETEAGSLDDELRQAYGEGYDELSDYAWKALVSLLEHEDANTPAEAVAIFRQHMGALAGGQQQTPGATAVVMPAGGGMPSNQVDPRTLDKNGRKEMVLSMLQAANQQQ